MKGLKIIRAMPSNAIDVHPLFEKAAKEGIYGEVPKDKEIKNQYFKTLDELKSPYHLYYLAQRGRGFFGFVHAVVIPGRWTGAADHMYVDAIYVTPGKRKNGIGRKLIEELRKEAENIGIRRVEFSCSEEQIKYWEKVGAKKINVLMRMSL